MVNRLKLESIIVYGLGTLLLYIGLFFKFMKFNYGDSIYNISEFIVPVIEYIFIVLGIGVLIYQLISTKDIFSIYHKLIKKENDNSILIILLFSYLVLIIGPLLSPFKMFLFLFLYALVFCGYFLTIKKDFLYISTCLFILLQFFDKLIFVTIGNNFDIVFMIILTINLLIILTVVIDGIYKIIKKKHYLYNLIYLIINSFILLLMYMFEEVFIYSSNFSTNENYFIWYLPIICIPLIVLYLVKKTKIIKLFN